LETDHRNLSIRGASVVGLASGGWRSR